MMRFRDLSPSIVWDKSMVYPALTVEPAHFRYLARVMLTLN